jgi:kinesin family protein C1
MVGGQDISEGKVTVSISCFEIHIETVRDLLNPSNEQVQIMTNQNKFKPTELSANSFSDIKYVMDLAQENRKKAATAMNPNSSRSHSIYQLRIKRFAQQPDGSILESSEGALNLIDLAGSEKAKDAKTDAEHFKESTSINMSLTVLGDVISAIIKKNPHVPYRNSKLTHLLQNYMGGDAKTLMIVNVSPLQQHANETLQSLRFASKVNSCKGYSNNN